MSASSINTIVRRTRDALTRPTGSRADAWTGIVTIRQTRRIDPDEFVQKVSLEPEDTQQHTGFIAAVPDSPECNVNDPMSCNKEKHEVCLFVSGTYRCACPHGYTRLPDGRCLVINECENARLNTCSRDAECVDLAEGYSCQCKSGFADISVGGEPGRLCRRRVNECAQPQNFGVDCDGNAICVDTEEGYACRCRPGFADISEYFNKLPGRLVLGLKIKKRTW